MKTKILFYTISIVLFALCQNVIGQGRGKLIGIVKDKTTNESLIGVNIIVEGTYLGASSDIDGKYYIIGVSAGTYNLKASFIGYNSVTVKNVRVQTDLTTEINIELESTSYETETVVVSAENKLVQRDITSTRRTITSENMNHVPGLESSADIFKLNGGTVLGGAPQSLQLANGTQLQVRDESVKDVHIRGGRGGEILFMVDGMPVNHPLYGGRMVLDLNVNAVEQIELLTGAFSAEYGQAQSGVVNITTKKGGTKLHGGFEYKTDDFNFLPENYNTHYGSFNIGGPELLTGQLLPLFGIKSPGSLKFFLTANATLTNTEYNNHKKRDDFSIFGINTIGKQDNSKNITGKIDWDVTNNIRTTISYNGSWKQWSAFSWEWINYPDHMVEYKRDNNNGNILVSHVLSQKTFYSLNLGYLGIKYNSSLDGLTPDKFWVINQDTVYSKVLAPQNDPLTQFRDDKGYETLWRDDNTKTYTVKFDFTSLFHPEHLIKIGFDAQFHDISYVDIQDGGYELSDYGRYLYLNDNYSIAPPGPYKEFGQYRWVFDVKPIVGGLYVQEKFEKEFMVINAGVRADWFYMGKSVDQADWKAQWKSATGMKADWNLLKVKLSPRFGISFPIQEQTVIFFSYGHFSQLPELQYFYRDPYSGGLTGNPKLDYEQTILYEFGLTHELFENWAIDIKSYAKDISKQVGTTQLLSASGLPVALYDNVGYARARGLEFELNKGSSYHTSGKVTYTVQWANGYSSSAFEDYIRSTNDWPNPIRERRLDWDVRHQLIFQGSLSATQDDPITLFGWEMPTDWDLTFLASLSSGQPYTPFSLDPAILQVTENTANGPITFSADVKFIKSFEILGGKFSFSVDVFNMFDQNNVNIYYGFNTDTGKPYKYGDVNEATSGKSQFYDWFTMFKKRDPRQFTTGRYIKFGVRCDI